VSFTTRNYYRHFDGLILAWAHLQLPCSSKPASFWFLWFLRSRAKVVELCLMRPEIALWLWLGVGFNCAQLIARRFNLSLEFDWLSQQSLSEIGVKFQAYLWLHSESEELTKTILTSQRTFDYARQKDFAKHR